MSTTEQDKIIKGNNPNGIGGFGDNPENINPGGRPKNIQRVGYWLQFFKDMTFDELNAYVKERTLNEMYVAELLAYEQVLKSRESFKMYKDMIDRTEGRAPQKIDLEVDDQSGNNINGNVLLAILEDIKNATSDKSQENS